MTVRDGKKKGSRLRWNEIMGVLKKRFLESYVIKRFDSGMIYFNYSYVPFGQLFIWCA